MPVDQSRLDGSSKLRNRERAALEQRAWVRLNYRCNDRCLFCLDADCHDGTDRDREEVKRDIVDGRRRGAARLVLSGGEPTIHPDFIGFVALGRRAGYRRMQVITNGRMFSYPDFLGRALDAGLGEITFSIHGPNAKVHDALVGARGAYDQALAGLENALADGRAIVNVDIVVTRANVERLREMLDSLCELGVREFDLLQVVPFGRAFVEGRGKLFYDLDQARPALQRAFEIAARPDIHLWLNRFPPEHLEGHEQLIQDPHKLFDEVRGRREEFRLLLERGVELDCRDPARCQHCFLERFCARLSSVREALQRRDFDAVRVDTEAGPVKTANLGGDPASARRSSSRAADATAPLPGTTSAALVGAARSRELVICAPDLPAALEVLGQHPDARRVELELASYAGLASALAESEEIGAAQLVRAVASTPDQARELVGISGQFEIVILLDRDTAGFLHGARSHASRMVVRLPHRDRVSESRARDVALPDFFASLSYPLRVDGVPPCAAEGQLPARRVFDAAMLGPDGRLEIFRFARWFIREGYMLKSRRCAACAREAACAGTHVTYVRAHGFGHMVPI